MQSTLDWMNFWLRGRERQAPDVPERFVRWHGDLRDWDGSHGKPQFYFREATRGSGQQGLRCTVGGWRSDFITSDVRE